MSDKALNTPLNFVGDSYNKNVMGGQLIVEGL